MMVLKCDEFGAVASCGHGFFFPGCWSSLVKERQLAVRSWLPLFITKKKSALWTGSVATATPLDTIKC